MTATQHGIDQAIVLAGGLGTRLRAVVSDVPKPMAPIGGRPFLDCLLSYWRAQGIQRFILSVGYKWQVIKNHFGTNFQGAEIEYAIENIPMGTGGGLCLAAEFLNPCETFLALNGDTFFEVNLGNLATQHREKQADLTLSLHRTEESGRYGGVTLDAQGFLTSFKSKAEVKPTESSAPGPDRPKPLINGGVYLIQSSVWETVPFPTAPLSLEDGLFGRLLFERKRFYGSEQEGRFIDIGLPEDYDAAPRVLEDIMRKL